jgi:hypothetical protein
MSTTATDARFRAVWRLGAAGSETMLARDLLQDRMVVVKWLAGAGSRPASTRLAITKMIVEGHGGEVRLESREGLGTTLRVLLPLVPATAGEAVL